MDNRYDIRRKDKPDKLTGRILVAFIIIAVCACSGAGVAAFGGYFINTGSRHPRNSLENKLVNPVADRMPQIKRRAKIGLAVGAVVGLLTTFKFNRNLSRKKSSL